jgi:hypothetical protein
MAQRLSEDEQLADAYARAHAAYLADRETLGHVPEIAGVSAGGMPTRVKCLHALVGHSLAAGPGVNPLGDEALAQIGDFWTSPCLTDGHEDDITALPTAATEAQLVEEQR